MGEIKRRKVIQVAAVYAVVSWLLVQIVATIEQPLSLPTWFDTAVIVFLAVGFPVAIILGWAFDITTHGIISTPPAATDSVADTPIHSATDAGTSTLPNSVAVLPFENRSPNPDDAYFAAGIHEEILSHLAKLKQLNVIARTSVMQYAGVARHIAEIADELNVGAVMEGSVRYAGDQVRVTAQLIDGATGTHLWTESYDGDLADIFTIQADIAKRIAEALNLHLRSEDQKSLEERPTDDLQAYECYLRARYEYSKFTPEGVQRSIHFLKQGLEFDADSELLNIALGNAYFNYGSAALGAELHDEYLVKAEECARSVLSINPDSADGNSLLGLILFDRFETFEGLRLMKQGVDAPDRNTDSLIWGVMCYSLCGQIKTAKPWVDELNRVDPFHGFSQWTVALYQLMDGEFEEAVTFLRRAHELEPDAPIFRTALALALIYLGRNSEAQSILKAGRKEEPRREVWHIIGRILDHILCDERAAASELLDDDLKEDAKTDMLYSWLLADCYALLGDADSSIEWLGNAIRGGFLNYPFFYNMDPLISDVRNKRDFDLLMTKAQAGWESVERLTSEAN
ncbi:MAG: tetratricopeptide repeat protein [Phycisphaerae bacterium]|nr:tetratricopeptide repeat protein [Phycisphaerae bacterium]NIU08426.1 tetratricopeptide repeat protein [Phycisphaerae bacterium]